MKIASKNANLIKQHEILKNSTAIIGESISDINKNIEKWPIQPSEKELPQPDVDVTFASISRVFNSFSNLLGPLEAGEAYKKLLEIRKQVNESKRKFENLKANKDTVGPEAVLKEAMNLRPLLSTLKKAESDFVYVLIHQWRSATQTIDSDLREIQKLEPTD